MRVVFDTNTVISALFFGGRMAWLVQHWQSIEVTPLISRETAGEILRVLAYPKFGLSQPNIDAFAARYLPFAERIEGTQQTMDHPTCRDPEDQKFVWLAIAGKADILVTGDRDLLDLREQASFIIETPTEYRLRHQGIRAD